MICFYFRDEKLTANLELLIVVSSCLDFHAAEDQVAHPTQASSFRKNTFFAYVIFICFMSQLTAAWNPQLKY